LRERAHNAWAAFEVGVIVSRQNGKGSILEARELAGLFEFGEQLILHSAHEFKTAAEAFRRVLSLIDGCDEYRRRVKKVQIGHGDEGIELRSGARLRFVARSTGSGRGFSGDLVILDEAYALTPRHMEALLPTLSARPNPQIWYTSSPPLDSDSGDVLFAARQRGEQHDPGRLAWFDFGAAGSLAALDDIDLDDIDLWRRTNPALGIRITEEFVAAERKAMTDQGFARERLGVWPPAPQQGSRIIPTDLWRTLAEPDSPRPANLAFALHVNADRTRAAVAYAGRRGDGLLQVGLVDWRAGTAWVVQRLVELAGKWSPVALAVDTRSEGLLLDLEKAGITVSEDPDQPEAGDLVIPAAADTAAAFAMFVDTARAEQLRHVDDAPVNTGLAQGRTRELAGGSTWDHRGPGEAGPLKAVTLALWAFEARAHLVVDDYDPVGQVF
jgi:hypothetical protein